MIFVDRDKYEKPKYFYSNEYEIKVNELRAFYKQPLKQRSQQRFNLYNVPYDLIYDLNRVFNGKCAYCESSINLDINKAQSYSLIDHFRPRNNAKGFSVSETSLEHYWWLMYEWENLYLCCLECNKYKSSWFPVKSKRAKPETPYKQIVKKEQNLIIDPCNDRIEMHLSFKMDGHFVPLDTKGETTIEILHLNRLELIEQRIKRLNEEVKNWDNVFDAYNSKDAFDFNSDIVSHWVELLRHESTSPHSGIQRLFLLEQFQKHPEIYRELDALVLFPLDIKPSVSNEMMFQITNSFGTGDNILLDIKGIPQGKNRVRELLKNIYISKIELKNYKCFDDLTINLSNNLKDKHEPWLVFLGENGVGKSSVIKAVALALMGQSYLDTLGLDVNKILKYRKQKGYIKVYGSKEGEIFEVNFNRKDGVLQSNITTPPCFLIGYGSTRLLPKGNIVPESDVLDVKVKNLFDYSIALSDAKHWLLNVPKRTFDTVAKSLKDVLLLDNEDIIKRDKRNKRLYIYYAQQRSKIDIEELSDGYKSIFAITIDIIETLSKDVKAFETAEAVVLIDEIGTHLHPRWKMEVVSRLRHTFPKIQFIATTHEPLCLRGLRKSEVSVLKKSSEGKILSIHDLPDPSEFRVDQLLTSEFFGLSSTLDAETEKAFTQYYTLLAKEDRTPEEQSIVAKLEKELPSKKHLGEDIRDELVYYVIDELLAKQVKDKGFKSVDDNIKEEAKVRVKEMWAFIDQAE